MDIEELRSKLTTHCISWEVTHSENYLNIDNFNVAMANRKEFDDALDEFFTENPEMQDKLSINLLDAIISVKDSV